MRFRTFRRIAINTIAGRNHFGITPLSFSKRMSSHAIVVDPFAQRQFNNPGYTGTQIFMEIPEFEKIINEKFVEGAPLVDGYAPFCKHIFIPNFLTHDLPCAYIPATEQVNKLIKWEYEARTPQELPVLVTYVKSEDLKNAGIEIPQATYLDIILYSREQIIKENEAMGREAPHDATWDWGVVSVKAQCENEEIPMQPITVMRNALGASEGGSGVPLDREAYQKSVDFWSKYVPIK